MVYRKNPRGQVFYLYSRTNRKACFLGRYLPWDLQLSGSFIDIFEICTLSVKFSPGF